MVASMKEKQLPFTKMHGLGNDFVLIEGKYLDPEGKFLDTPLEQLALYLCDRHFGVGADGLIVIAPPTDPALYDIRFVYLNSDGGWAEMCGNGIRCFARYVYEHGYISKDEFTVETLAGPIRPKVNPDKTVTVDMGAPVLEPEKIPFAGEGKIDPHSTNKVVEYPLNVLDKTIPVTLVSMGNPHCLIYQQDLEAPLDPAVFGPAIETHPAFPNKTNVEFLEVVDDHTLKATVWERGCGFTLACGTGACASAVGSILLEKTGAEVDVQLPGGTLHIFWDQQASGHVFMTGPATTVFTGEITIPSEIFNSTSLVS